MTSRNPLFVSDLDGTLLTADATLSDGSFEMLRKLLDAGLPFTVATARTYHSVLPILRGLPIKVPMIMQNGAVLYDMQQKRVLQAEVIAPQAYCSVCEAMRNYAVDGFVYCVDDGILRCCYRELTTESMRQFYQERRDRYEKPFYQVDSLAKLVTRHPVYVTMNAPQAVLQPLVDALKTTQGLTLSYYRDVYREGIWYLEISADTADKRHGIMRLREMFGFDFITGFGDNINDLPLFAACDQKVAVANAADTLKSAADTVIGSNLEDAVPQYLATHWHSVRK